MACFAKTVTPDADAFLANLRREGTPQRVHYIELSLDVEVQVAVCKQFDLTAALSEDDPFFSQKRQIALHRFLGYDYVFTSLEGLDFPIRTRATEDTAGLPHAGGRHYADESRGPISSWSEFETYPWPDPHRACDRIISWYNANLPDDMMILPHSYSRFCMMLTALMGYETLCFALFEQRDLVRAIVGKLLEIWQVVMARLVQFEKVRAVWAGDDMGFKTSTLISPADLREFVLPNHKILAEMAHQAGRPYLLHSCGNLREIMPDLINDVKIDAKHSFEDAILPPTEAKALYGDRIAILGGIDVDFLCRSDEPTIRKRVRRTLDACMPGGGYCLGSGNSIANYVPVDNYLAMLDEGRRYAG